MGDKDPGVAALGFQAIAALLEADELDFYKAWPVVHAIIPDVPAEPVLAREWVGLLQFAALDAAVEPERAAVVVDLLWRTTSQSSPLVRSLKPFFVPVCMVASARC
jgi:Protein of unknown function (DUF3730)